MVSLLFTAQRNVFILSVRVIFLPSARSLHFILFLFNTWNLWTLILKPPFLTWPLLNLSQFPTSLFLLPPFCRNVYLRDVVQDIFCQFTVVYFLRCQITSGFICMSCRYTRYRHTCLQRSFIFIFLLPFIVFLLFSFPRYSSRILFLFSSLVPTVYGLQY